MSNYRRLISYIYAYEGGVKGKNIGFAKLEVRNGQCKLNVNVKKVYVGSNNMGVYLLADKREIFLGNIFVRNGAGEFRAIVQASNVENTGSTIDECYGLTVHEVENAWQSYTTIWEDAVARTAELDLADVTSENQMEKDMKRKNIAAIPTEAPAQKKSAMADLEQEIDNNSAAPLLPTQNSSGSACESSPETPIALDGINSIPRSCILPSQPMTARGSMPLESMTQGSMAQGSALGSADQASTSPGSISPASTFPESAAQGSMPQGYMPQGSMTQGSTPQESIAQESTYQSSTAQGSANQHSEAQEYAVPGSETQESVTQRSAAWQFETQNSAEVKQEEKIQNTETTASGTAQSQSIFNNGFLNRLANLAVERYKFRPIMDEMNRTTVQAQSDTVMSQPKAKEQTEAVSQPEAVGQPQGSTRVFMETSQELQPEMRPHITQQESRPSYIGDPAELEQLEQEEKEESNHEQLWEKLRKIHTKMPAFDYEHGCEILTIKPQDIGLLPRETWGYGNNSFLLHGYYNYRYLILAKLFNPEGSPRYLLGVPGHYYSNEKYMASMFGFPNFVLAKQQPAKDGRFGFWYADIRLGN